LKSCEMRYVILKHELDEVAVEQQQIVKRKSKIKAGTCTPLLVLFIA